MPNEPTLELDSENNKAAEPIDNNKITWVIGDIHGMLDPLRYLVDRLDNEQLGKFVFTGDFIDHGPSSKQVLDFIMSLGDKAVCILGNHDWLLLESLYNEQHRDRFGWRIWDENGGMSTVRSFGYRSYEEFEANIDPKYTDFLKSLRCFHTENIDYDGKIVKYLITHAGVMPKVSVVEQLAVQNYEQHNEFIRNRRIWIEDSFIWVRDDFFNGDPDHWKEYVVIHGHSPTHLLHYYVRGLKADGYDQFAPYVRAHPTTKRTVSIDIDTAAAFGHRLTALGLWAGFTRVFRPTIQAMQLDVKQGYYRNNPMITSEIRVQEDEKGE